MPDNALRKLLDDILLEWIQKDEGPMAMGALDASTTLTQAHNLAEERGIRFDWRSALEYWWHLARLGVIATSGQQMSNYSGRPHTFITMRGREYLRRGVLSPHHPARYLEAVRARVQKPDEVALAYLDEAVGAWEAQLYRATMVMVGCAYERAVLELARALSACTSSRASEKIRKKLSGDRHAPVSELFDDVRAAVAELDDAGQLPGTISDTWDRNITVVFEYVRVLRNKSGHPTGEVIGAGEAEGALVTFPDFYERMDKLTRHVRELP